jgi:membrane fusion protein, multidrug efflux system
MAVTNNSSALATWVFALVVVFALAACGKPAAGPNGGAAGPGQAAGQGGRPGGGTGGGQGSGRPVTVVAATVSQQPWQDRIEALGTASANESVVITAKVADSVRDLKFDDGDRVERGQVLVSLTNTEETALLDEAVAALAEARRQEQRLQRSVQSGAVTRQAMDQAKSQVEQAEARVDSVRARLSDRVISAPFAGRLGFRQISEGAFVSPGTAITTLDDLSRIKLDFRVPETLLGAIQIGDQIKAAAAAFPGQAFSGRIEQVDTRIDPVTRSLTVRALLPNDKELLKPGMLLTVKIESQPRQATVVPELAVQGNRDKSTVFRINGGKAELVELRIGARHDGMVEVLDGLQVGDQVVTEGLAKVRPGAQVQLGGASAAKAPPAPAATPAAPPVNRG